MLKRLLSSTFALYVIFGIIALLICNFKIAAVQRMYELHRFSTYLPDYISDCAIRNVNCEVNEPMVHVALRHYTLMAKEMPEMVRANEMRGLCYLLLKDDRHAIEAFNAVLKVRPNFYWDNFEKGMAYCRLGRWDEALKIFQDINRTPEQDLLNNGLLPSISFLPPSMQGPFVASLKGYTDEMKIVDQEMILLCLSKLHRYHDPSISAWEEVWEKYLLVGTHPWTILYPSVTQPFQD